MTILPNKTFCLVYYIWQLVYMIQHFLLFRHKMIYKCKLVNSPPVESMLLVTQLKFYSPQDCIWMTLRSPAVEFVNK